ncbi:MAG: DUF4097 family beta strand repeat-containing protein [Bacteroidota bacterium]
MRLHRIFPLMLLLGFVTSMPAQAFIGYDVEDIVKESFKVRAGGTLYIEMDYGNIEVEVGDDDAVHIEMIRTVRVNSESEARKIFNDFHSYSFEQRRDDVTIESRYTEKRGGWGKWGKKNRFKITMKIIVPEDYNVDFETGAGNIDLGDLAGEVNGRTGAGNITIGAVDGIVDITSGAGNVNVYGATEHVEVHTGAGNIELNDVTGYVRANTGAGNVTASITSQPESDSKLETGAGNVTVYLSRKAGVFVEAIASMGSASSDYPLKIQGKWMTKSFEGEVNGGGPDLFMRAGVGNVSLRSR